MLLLFINLIEWHKRILIAVLFAEENPKPPAKLQLVVLGIEHIRNVGYDNMIIVPINLTNLSICVITKPIYDTNSVKSQQYNLTDVFLHIFVRSA